MALPIPAPGLAEVEFPAVSRPLNPFGYSCQVYLVLRVIEEVYRAALPWVWFSTTFNPVDNADSSNPAEIYLAVNRAVRTGDVGSKIIRGYKASLLDHAKNVPDPAKRQSLRKDINDAPIDYFRPQVWLLDLQAIAVRKGTSLLGLLDDCRRQAQHEVSRSPGQTLQPDEYLIKDLESAEYAVIVDG